MKHVLHFWPRTKKERPTAEQLTWPLHTPAVEVCNTVELIRRSEDKRLAKLWNSLQGLQTPSGREKKSALAPADVEKIIKSGIARYVTWEATAFAYTLVEEAKHRRRLIVWPREYNNLPYEAEIRLLTPAQVIAQLKDKRKLCAKIYDVKCAFFQHVVPESFQKYLVCELDDGTRIAFQRLPMGATISPEIRQRLGEAVVKLTAKETGQTIAQRVKTVVHIDNFRFLGEAADVASFAEAFEKVCRNLAITLNTDENQEVFLGMRFDYAQKSVRLAQKTVDKLPRLETLQRQMPLEEVERLMGRLFFAAEILAIDLKHAYYAIKFYRAMCRRLTKGEHPHTIVTWWSAAWEQLRWWLSMALTNEVRYIEAVTQSDTTATIFTDASTTGFGIVIINGGHVLEYGASWYHSKFWRERGYLPHITHLELWAVGTAVRLARACGIQSAHLFVDNMAALAALKNR